MAKICYLFGAGAEGKGNYGIINGFEYFKKTLFINSMDDVYHNLFDFLSEKQYFRINDSFYKYEKRIISISIRTLEMFLINYIDNRYDVNDGFEENEKNEIVNIFSYDFVKELDEKYNLNIDLKSYDNNQNIKQKNIYRNKAISELKKIFTCDTILYNELETEILKKIFFDNFGKVIRDINVGVPNLLDSYFHTIINPIKYGSYNFSKIFNYYWTCYFVIIKNIIASMSAKNKKLFSDYIEKDKLNCQKVVLNINDFTTKLYSINDNQNGSTYYDLIRKKTNEFNNKLTDEIQNSVITTNYYKFIEILDENPSYLNGNLKMFELPELLEVVDFTNNKLDWNKNLFFPFIFGQSLVKPIVHSYQIEQFSNAFNKLNTADYLVIIGYGINDDDNHVNSLLHNSIIDDHFKKIIIVDKCPIKSIIKSLKINNSSIEDKILLIDFTNKSNEEIIETIFKIIKNN